MGRENSTAVCENDTVVSSRAVTREPRDVDTPIKSGYDIGGRDDNVNFEPAVGIGPTVSSLPMTCFATKLCWHIGRIE